MNYPAVSCKVSNPSFWLVQNLSEGFPTSGNDRTRKMFTTMQSIEEFF